MPAVPYTPAPNVSPTEAGTPSISVNAPAAAFGGAVGQALEHLGQVESHVGDEIFKRALALQELQNETAAKEQDAQYMMKVGQLHADFSALQGQQAVAAYPKYMQDIQQLRTKMRNDLPNDATRRMYDSSSISTMGRTIFNGAGHAATQQKMAANGASVARVDTLLNNIYQNPEDEVGYTRNVRGIVGEIHSQGDLHGWSKEQTQNNVEKVISKALAHRITGLSKTEPFKAQEMFEDNKSQLHGDDIDRVENTVRMQTRNTGARVEAIKLTDYMNEPRKEGEPEKTEATLVKEARAKAKELAPNDPLFGQALEQHVISIYNRNKRIEKDNENRNTEDINTAIMGGFSEGKVPTSIDELKAVNPRVSAAIDALPPHKQIEIPAKINRYNKAINQKTEQEIATRLTGMATGSDDSVAEFLNLDITQQKLSQHDMQRFIKLQNDKRKNATADPRVTKAIGWMRNALGSQMEALGIFRRTDSNKEDYDHFTGALQSAIEIYQETNKKVPSYNEIVNEIGPQVIRQTRVPGWLWKTNPSDPFFKQIVPKSFSDPLKADIFDRTGEELSEAQIYKAWIRSQYIKLHGKKEDKKSTLPSGPEE